MIEKNLFLYADQVLNQRGGKWTAPRRTVFEALVTQDKPITAYQLLDHIGATKAPIKPPSVYRALAFLQEMGLVVKVEGLNAFMMCKHTHAHSQHVFFVCDSCGDTDEHCSDKITDNLTKSALVRGFKPSRQIVELHGQCTNCQG